MRHYDSYRMTHLLKKKHFIYFGSFVALRKRLGENVKLGCKPFD